MSYYSRRISALFIMLIAVLNLPGMVSKIYPDHPAEIEIQAFEQPGVSQPAETLPSDKATDDVPPGVDTEQSPEPVPATTMDAIPQYTGQPYTEINGSAPFFTENELTTEAFEYYTPLDELGRCGCAFANICPEIIPTEPRGQIGMIKPSGWHTVRYDDLIEDHYLYNRCHLIGYQLAGENDNVQNLITGTRYMNVDGMQPFENRVAGYVQRTGNHVLFRVTPAFEGQNLVASGVLMEALSVEDEGSGISFCVFVFNVQPGIVIDYATGESSRLAEPDETKAPITEGYIGNLRSHVFHLPTCPNLPAEKNQTLFDTRDAAVEAGYRPCGNCHP